MAAVDADRDALRLGAALLTCVGPTAGSWAEQVIRAAATPSDSVLANRIEQVAEVLATVYGLVMPRSALDQTRSPITSSPPS